MPGKKSKQLLIRARKVMEKIIDTGINNQNATTREDIRKFSFQESKLFFVNAYSKLISILKEKLHKIKKRNIDEIVFTTLYNDILALEKIARVSISEI